MLDKMFRFVVRLMCLSLILLMFAVMLINADGKNNGHPVITAILILIVSIIVFRKISPVAGLIVGLVAFFIVAGINGGTDVYEELVNDLSPVISYGIGFAILYFLFLAPRKGGSDDSATGNSRDSGRHESHRDSELENEQRRDKMKAWGQPVGSGSCPYLLRIEMGYYESWNCYRCAKTGSTFDDGFCRNLCYYEPKYKNCGIRNS